ncbi:hypothetical protein W02_32070 [Nitrospira sp. KM1]|uniref:hypothetical protein n=1 Tax=Nitrospira sp. KM1 TaxID=1936990 RepID=UPI0013A72699|nr:hypothetical protein [Nitrospira sp. KM1]BCA56067.1 hypothetical protein W02_32070 [Nitrospira sp. KM1]
MRRTKKSSGRSVKRAASAKGKKPAGAGRAGRGRMSVGRKRTTGRSGSKGKRNQSGMEAEQE